MIGDHNRIESDGQSNYQYDHEGNRISRTSIANGSYQMYEWNYRNQLIAITSFTDVHEKTGRVEYEYDALNRRIRRRVDETGDGTFEIQQRFLYDTNVYNASYAEVVLIIDETAAVDSPSTFDPSQEVEHRFLNGPMLDQVFSDENAVGEIVWNLQDRQNTVTDVVEFAHTDSDGHYDEAQLLNHLEYDAHGNIASQTDSSHQPVQTYTGQILDDFTGLMYYDARWFDPNVNQFISVDPIGFAAGDTNLKRYVGNGNPNGTDPSGLRVTIDRQKLRRAGGALILRAGRLEPRNINASMAEPILRSFENDPDAVSVWYHGDPKPLPEAYFEQPSNTRTPTTYEIRKNNAARVRKFSHLRKYGIRIDVDVSPGDFEEKGIIYRRRRLGLPVCFNGDGQFIQTQSVTEIDNGNRVAVNWLKCGDPELGSIHFNKFCTTGEGNYRHNAIDHHPGRSGYSPDKLYMGGYTFKDRPGGNMLSNGDRYAMETALYDDGRFIGSVRWGYEVVYRRSPFGGEKRMYLKEFPFEFTKAPSKDFFKALFKFYEVNRMDSPVCKGLYDYYPLMEEWLENQQ